MAAALTVGACAASPTTAPVQLSSEVVRGHIDPDEAKAVPDLASAADALALDLLVLALDLLVGAGDETTVTSPASLQVTLSMVAESADEQTLSQLEALIGATGQERSDGMNALIGALADLDGDPAVAGADELPAQPVVHRASRLLVDDSLTVEQSFVDTLARSYDADAETTDLAGDGAKQVLDAWVEEQTGGLVPRSALTPGPELRLAPHDAVVLAARWEQPFPAELTQPYPFTLPAGDQVEADMVTTGATRETT